MKESSGIANVLMNLAQNAKVCNERRMKRRAPEGETAAFLTRDARNVGEQTIRMDIVRKAEIRFIVQFIEDDYSDEGPTVEQRIARALGQHIYGDLFHEISRKVIERMYQFMDRTTPGHPALDSCQIVLNAFADTMNEISEEYSGSFDYQTYHISQVTPAMAVDWMYENTGQEVSIKNSSASLIMAKFEDAVEWYKACQNSPSSERYYFEKDIESRGRPKLFDVVF